eukprot:765107-Hanusia_phi.AAC.4
MLSTLTAAYPRGHIEGHSGIGGSEAPGRRQAERRTSEEKRRVRRERRERREGRKEERGEERGGEVSREGAGREKERAAYGVERQRRVEARRGWDSEQARGRQVE